MADYEQRRRSTNQRNREYDDRYEDFGREYDTDYGHQQRGGQDYGRGYTSSAYGNRHVDFSSQTRDDARQRDYDEGFGYDQGYGITGGAYYGEYNRDNPRSASSEGASGRGQHYGRGPKGYRRSDTTIQEEINERLTWHHDLDATHIQVSVQNGEVTLDGSVENRHQKRMAEDTAESVRGVEDVHNRLRVDKTLFQQIKDGLSNLAGETTQAAQPGTSQQNQGQSKS